MKKNVTHLFLIGLLSSTPIYAETTITLEDITLSGLIELQANYSEPESGESSGDVVVATTKIGIQAKVNSLISAKIELLYEEGTTPLDVDTSTLTISPDGSNWHITGGQQILPFGRYKTNMISDPITQVMGETLETALVLGANQGALSAALFAFNGDEYEGSNVGIDLAYKEKEAGFTLSYMDNLSESNGIIDLSTTKKVAGVISSGYFTMNNFNFSAEYIGSLDRYDASVLSYKGRDAEPTSWNVELSMDIDAIKYALAVQGSDEAVALGLPENKLLASISTDIAENSTLLFEAAEEKDYAILDGGETGEKTLSASVMLAVAF